MEHPSPATSTRHGTRTLIATCALLGLAGCGQQADVAARITELQQQVQQLQHQVQNLNDIEAIQRLERAYGYYVDKNLWTQVVALFADDATVELDERGVFVGKAGVQRMFLTEFGGGQDGLKHGTLFNHIQVEGIVDVAPDGRSAKARFHAIIQVSGFGGEQGFWSDGVYENQFIKQDGVWKFHTMRFWPTYYAPYQKGWSSNAQNCINGDGSGLSRGADRPSTDKAGVFPDVFYPPFHYPNPVTGQAVDVSALNVQATARTTWTRCAGAGSAATSPRPSHKAGQDGSSGSR